jgi:hypothetical protein
MFESDIVSFVGGLEAAYLQPGDIFAVSDEVKNVARTFGRILNVDDATNVISIDGEFKQGTPSTIGLDSGIYIHVPSGNYSVSDLNNLTNSNGEFTGTLQNIRARRQQQLQRYNIHTVTDGVANDNSFGARITLTGEFLLKSGIFETYPIEGRILNGGSYTGDTILTGEVYVFPDNTIVTGNPRWETLNFAAVSGVLLENEIDIDVQGSAGTGQLIGKETNLYCVMYVMVDGSEERLVRQIQIPGIKANQSQILAVFLPGLWWQEGAGRMELFIDQAEQIEERNETNNSVRMSP